MSHDSWPAYVEDALAQMSIVPEEAAQRFLDRFEQQWGALDMTSFTKALSQGGGDDQIFAICAVRYMASPQSNAMLLPLLQSSHTLGRWAAAVCLAELGETDAYPALGRVLTEPSVAEPSIGMPSIDRVEYDWRIFAATLIGRLGETSLVPALRSGLILVEGQLAHYDAVSEKQRTLESLRQSVFYPGANGGGTDTELAGSPSAWNDVDRDLLVEYEDEIVYSLGRLRGYGALVGVQASEEKMLVWMVHAIMGHLHGRFSWEVLAGRELDPAFQAEVKQHLRHYFGLDQETQACALDQYLRVNIGKLLVRWQLDITT